MIFHLYCDNAPLLVKTKQKRAKKNCLSWTSSGKTSGSAHVNLVINVLKY